MMLVLLMAARYETVFAQNIVNKSVLVEQAKARAPHAKVYLTGTNVEKSAEVSAKVGEIILSQDGQTCTFEESGESIRYVILFDNSGSINKVQFEEAKIRLEKLRRELKNEDEMQLFTVGTRDIEADKTDVLGRIVTASDKKQLKEDCEKIQGIEYIQGPESRTILYRSLNEVLEEQAGQMALDRLRTVIILITDGEDDSDEINGRNNDKDVTLENIKASSIPVYGILLDDTAKAPDEEKIKFTKNQLLNPVNGRGYFYNCGIEGKREGENKTEEMDPAGLVGDAFETLTNVLKKQTYVVALKADSNRIVTGKSELSLTVDNKATEPVWVDYSDYEADNDAPVIVGIAQKEGRNTITFTIEDENGVNLDDAGEGTHYTVQSEADGKSYAIEQVNVNPDGISANVSLTIAEEDFLNGEYTVVIDGVRDESQDENAMKQVRISFTVEDGLDPTVVERKEIAQKYWWVALIIIVVTLGVIALILLKKRAVKVVQVGNDAGELNEADRKLIRLTITDRLGTTREVEYNVEGSVFIGRSDICEIFFDDDRLSKQHFVIEVTKMGCYINDLDSTNGTFVNGVKVNGRRLLLDDDIITAGRETFVIHMEKEMFAGSDEFAYAEQTGSL